MLSHLKICPFKTVVQLTFGIWNIRKKATASILNQRVSQVPGRAKLILLLCLRYRLLVIILKAGSALVLPDVKGLTYCALSYGVAEFYSKFKSNWSTGAGQTDAKHK